MLEVGLGFDPRAALGLLEAKPSFTLLGQLFRLDLAQPLLFFPAGALGLIPGPALGILLGLALRLGASLGFGALLLDPFFLLLAQFLERLEDGIVA